MSLASPKISVIVPAYNAAATIASTLQGIKEQTYLHWEVLVVDDGSSDQTAAQVLPFTQSDHRFRLLSQTNQGAAAARNTGIKKAQHEWLLFLDADDALAPRYLERMAQELAEHPALDAVHCGWVRVGPDGNFLGAPQLPQPAEDLFPDCARRCPFAIHACVVRRKMVEAAGAFDTTLRTSEDWDLWQRIARMGARFGAVPELLAYYQVQPRSLSRSAEQAFADGLRVLERAYAPDPRLATIPHLYKDGFPKEDLAGLKTYLLTWFAGLLLGQGKETGVLFQLLGDQKGVPLDAHWLAHSLFDSIPLAKTQTHTAWKELWPEVAAGLKQFLSSLEERSGMRSLAQLVLRHLETIIAQNWKGKEPLTIGRTHIVDLEITRPIPTISLAQAAAERLYCRVTMEGSELGHLELPVCGATIPSWVLKDALAARFAWPVLGRFFEQTIYKKDIEALAISPEEWHDQTGWTVFLQQLWGKPHWPEEHFYNLEYKEETKPGVKPVAVPEAIEISTALPDIKTEESTATIKVRVGGASLGKIQVPVSNKMATAQQLLVFINEATNYELCVACVREALIGRSLQEAVPLRVRLQQAAAASQDNPAPSYADGQARPHTLMLGRRSHIIGTSSSRRAVLPASTASTLMEMAKATGETIVQVPDASSSHDTFYVPEISSPVSGNKEVQPVPEGEQKENLYDRQYFETLFSKQADPWKYTHPYEQTKYELTLSLIPEGVDKALEIACAEGHFTAQLAPLVKELTAVDISQVALQRTAERCRQFGHIRYGHFDIVKDEIKEQYDLIVCSEVLYYVGEAKDLRTVAKKFARALQPGGYLVMAHAHQIIDEPDQTGFDWGLPFGAKVIGETFARTAPLRLVKEIRTPLYRVQLFQRQQPSLFSWLERKKPDIKLMEQPSPLPPEVEAYVRWQGGKPSGILSAEPVVTRKLPILMYHRVAPEGAESLKRYRISPDLFEEQLQYLRDSGYYSVQWSHWLQALVTRKPLPGKAIALTFDDGYSDFYEYAWPLLKKYGFTATVFLVSDCIGKTNNWDKQYGEEVSLMGAKEIRELQQQGVSFGAHTAHHPFLTTLSPEQIVQEGARSRTALEKLLGVPVHTIAYPYGDTNAGVEHLMGGCGYTIGLSCNPGLSTLRDNALCLPRIEVKGSDTLPDFIAKISG